MPPRPAIERAPHVVLHRLHLAFLGNGDLLSLPITPDPADLRARLACLVGWLVENPSALAQLVADPGCQDHDAGDARLDDGPAGI